MNRTKFLVTGLSALCLASLGVVFLKQDESDARRAGRSFVYEVQLTNLTRAQIFSPGVLAALDLEGESLDDDLPGATVPAQDA